MVSSSFFPIVDLKGVFEIFRLETFAQVYFYDYMCEEQSKPGRG